MITGRVTKYFKSFTQSLIRKTSMIFVPHPCLLSLLLVVPDETNTFKMFLCTFVGNGCH